MYDSNVRTQPWLHRYIVSKLYPFLFAYVRFGNEAHKLYLKRNYGREYNASVRSNERYVVGNPYRAMNKAEAEKRRQYLLNFGTCKTPCSCATPYAYEVPGLYDQFSSDIKHKEVIPRGFVNASAILNLQPISDDVHHHFALYNTHTPSKDSHSIPY